MAATTTELIVRLSADAKGFAAELGSASKSVESLNDKAKVLGTSMQEAGRRMTLGLTLPFVAMGLAAVKGIGEAQKFAAQTEAALRSTGGVANVTADQITNLTLRLRDLSGVDDDLIRDGANLLLTFTNIRNEVGKGNDIFSRATRAALDLSIAFGTDMHSASIMLGKALNDPIAGLTSLGRAGVQFTTEQKETIRSMVETGDVLGAQKLILQELETQVGGSAAAYGETLPGQLSKAKLAFEEASESLISSMLPALQLMSDAVVGVAGFIGDLPQPVKTVIGVFGALVAAAGPVLWITGSMVKNVSALADAFPKLGPAIASAAAAAGPWIIAAGLLAAAVYKVQDAVRNGDGQWTVYTQNLMRLTDSQIQNASQVLLAKQGYDNFKDTIRQVAAESATTAQKMVEGSGLTGKAKESLLAIVEKEIAAQHRAAGAAQADAAALDAVGASAGTTEAALESLNAAVDAETDASLRLEGAQISMETAINNANRVIEEQGADTLEARSALLSAKQSVEEWGQATYENARKAGDTVAEAKDKQLWALGEMAAGMAPGSPLRVWLEAYIARLNSVPRNIKTMLEVEAHFATSSAGTGTRGRAAGGPVMGGTPYLVGEVGPELFVPSVSGTIIPNHALTSSGGRAAGGSSNTYAINVQVAPGGSPAETGRAIVEAIKSYEDRSGATWRAA